MEQRFYSMTEAAQRLNVSYWTIARAIVNGTIAYVKTPGGRRRIPEDEVVRLLKEYNRPESQN